MHFGLPGEREETMKPTAPCSGVHGPPTEVTLPLGTWHSRELLGTYCQSMSKVDLGEGENQRDNTGHGHPQTGRAWNISARKELTSPLSEICLNLPLAAPI